MPLPAETGDIRRHGGRVRGRLKQAIDLMVMDGTRDHEAARMCNINVLSIRNALRSGHYLAYYREQLHVLRERESAANIHALIDVRDNSENQAARVNAVNALERIGNQAPSSSGQAQIAGFVIVVPPNTGRDHVTINQVPIDAKALNSQENDQEA